MVKKIFVTYGLVFSLMASLLSCTEEIDFNQADDLVLTPVIENSLLFFDAPASEFFVGGMEVSEASDFIEIDLFGSSFVRDDVTKIEFVFEVINSINRGYELQVDFLNRQNRLEYTFTFDVSASADNSDVYTKYTEVFEGSALNSLKKTEKLSFTLTMLPGADVTENSPGRINMESKSVFYFNI